MQGDAHGFNEVRCNFVHSLQFTKRVMRYIYYLRLTVCFYMHRLNEDISKPWGLQTIASTSFAASCWTVSPFQVSDIPGSDRA